MTLTTTIEPGTRARHVDDGSRVPASPTQLDDDVHSENSDGVGDRAASASRVLRKARQAASRVEGAKARYCAETGSTRL
jgi:hypothetical protein